MKTQELTDLNVVLSLRSTTCPACGSRKQSAKTLCLRDYRRLPGKMRNDLYNRVRCGYREAVIAALQFLDVAEPAIPASGNTLFGPSRGAFRE